MKNNNQIGQELSKFTPVELVGYEDEEAGSPDALASWVVHVMLSESIRHTEELVDEAVERTLK